MKKNKLTTVIFLASVLIIFLPFYAFGERYIVDSTTSSTNWDTAEWTNYPDPPTCTPVTPKTAMSNADDDDIVYFRGGNYDYSVEGPSGEDSPILNPSNSGSPGHYITFRNYPAETPTMRNTAPWINEATSFFCIIGVAGKDYIIWDGFKVTGTNIGSKIRLTGTDNCIIRNCENKGVPGTFSIGNYDAIRSEGSTNLLIHNNLVHGFITGNHHGAGFKSYSSSYVIVEYNTFYENDCDVYFKNADHDSTIRYNFIYAGSYVGEGGTAIGFAADAGGPRPYNMIAHNNVIRQGTNESDYFFKVRGGDSSNILIYNNTLYAPDNFQAWGLNADPALINFSDAFFNNAIYIGSNGRFHLRYKDTRVGYSNHNIFDGSTYFQNASVTYSSMAAWQTSAGTPDANSYHETITWNGPVTFSTNPTDFKFSATHENSGRNADGYSSKIGAYITGNEQIGYIYNPLNNPDPQQSLLPPIRLRIE